MDFIPYFYAGALHNRSDIKYWTYSLNAVIIYIGRKQFSDPGLQFDPTQTPIPVSFLGHTMLLTASGQMEVDMYRWKT